MILNRKSAKQTSRVSLLVALVALAAIYGIVETQGYPIDALALQGVDSCRLGLVEFLSMIFW